jgi:hypothetical protein
MMRDIKVAYQQRDEVGVQVKSDMGFLPTCIGD